MDDKIVYRRDLQVTLRVSSETLRRWIKAGRLPKPDVSVSARTTGWRMSTLSAAGFSLPG
jgi:predicted DNA-binding transcriptional regulator AlpA